mmetsp:Transcript_26283/g.37672  ORF Transcript_26283/g.37672 Transcript_26283/m.37672 type:complete len:81 (+) Transcript_26283:239-481(+)
MTKGLQVNFFFFWVCFVSSLLLNTHKIHFHVSALLIKRTKQHHEQSSLPNWVLTTTTSTIELRRRGKSVQETLRVWSAYS